RSYGCGRAMEEVLSDEFVVDLEVDGLTYSGIGSDSAFSGAKRHEHDAGGVAELDANAFLGVESVPVDGRYVRHKVDAAGHELTHASRSLGDDAECNLIPLWLATEVSVKTVKDNAVIADPLTYFVRTRADGCLYKCIDA